MSRRASPVPPAVVRGIAGLTWVQGRLDVALGILIGFHCMLRDCEVLRLRFCDCMHFGDTIVLDLVCSRQGQEKTPENRSQSQTVRRSVCFGISVVNASLQSVWCVCLLAISGNFIRVYFLSSVLVTKVFSCIPCDAVTLDISSVWLEISAQRLNVTDDSPFPRDVCTSTKGWRFCLIAKSDLPSQQLWG